MWAEEEETILTVLQPRAVCCKNELTVSIWIFSESRDILTLCAKLCAIRTSESVLNVSLELVITTSLYKMIRHPSENL